VEKIVNDEQSIRQFLKGMYGARGPKGEIAFDPEKGVLSENLPSIGESKILNGKVRDDFPCWNACRVRDRGREIVGTHGEHPRCCLLKEHYETISLLDRCIATSDMSCRKDEKALRKIDSVQHEHAISCVGHVEID
jgi:hypothetical protein